MQNKNFRIDEPQEICSIPVGIQASSSACFLKLMRRAKILVVSIDKSACQLESYQHAKVYPNFGRAIVHLESAISEIERQISELIRLGTRIGYVNKYPRPRRANPGHNWVWSENGMLKKKCILLAQVNNYRAECDRAEKVRALKGISRAIQEQIDRLRGSEVQYEQSLL